MGQISTRSHLYRHRADCHSRHLLNLERERPGTNPVLRQKTLSSVLGFGAREMIHELYNKVTLYVGFKALGFCFSEGPFSRFRVQGFTSSLYSCRKFCVNVWMVSLCIRGQKQP